MKRLLGMAAIAVALSAGAQTPAPPQKVLIKAKEYRDKFVHHTMVVKAEAPLTALPVTAPSGADNRFLTRFTVTLRWSSV